MFYAVYMPGAGWKGFSTCDEAIAFIESRRCDSCKEAAKTEHGGQSCDAEWDVWTEDDWNEFGPLSAEYEIKPTGQPEAKGE